MLACKQLNKGAKYMGRYLAIGLVHRISVSLEDMRKHGVSSEEIRTQMTQDYSIDLDLYDVDGEKSTDKTMESTCLFFHPGRFFGRFVSF